MSYKIEARKLGEVQGRIEIAAREIRHAAQYMRTSEDVVIKAEAGYLEGLAGRMEDTVRELNGLEWVSDLAKV